MPNHPDEQELKRQDESLDLLEKPPDPLKTLLLSLRRSIGPAYPPFMDKIDKEHITKVLEYTENQDKRGFEDTKSERLYGLIKLILICIVFVFIFVFMTVYLVDRDKDLYKDIVKIALGFLSGLAAGYGLAKRGSKEKDE